jgi:hypothetical protein
VIGPTEPAREQGGGQGPGDPVRRVDGVVVRGTRAGQTPVANQWVVLHRVGPDRAGPLDSVRTSATGAYAMHYRATGDTSALYFTSTSYGGVAYFTPPLRAVNATGDDTRITVFDTTSARIPVVIGGRHLIVAAAGAGGTRPVGEVYDLQNDTTVTLVARDSSTPLWSAHIPAAAQGARANAGGTIAAGAMTFRNGVAGLYAPLSPGFRQVAFSYDLPAKSFPLVVPLERPTGLLEIMVEEPRARVEAPRLREVAPVNADGRTFRRFLAQDLDANAVVRIDVPSVGGPTPQLVDVGVGAVVAAAMLVALLFATRRSPRLPGAASLPAAPSAAPSDLIAHQIAELDDAFEHRAAPAESEREAYESRRADLKRQLADALANERTRE